MLERLRFWVASSICPPVTVKIKVRGRQHFFKGVKIKPQISVLVVGPEDIAPSGAGDMTATEAQKLIDSATVALTDEERDNQGRNYAGMTGEEAAERDEVFRRANALRGSRPVPPDVVARLRGNLQDEGKLPK